MKIINCHNTYHLGDCIQSLHFLLNASEQNGVMFNFFCNPIYHNQLEGLLDGYDGVQLSNEPFPGSFDLWIGAHDYGGICRQSDEIYGDESDQGTYFLLLCKKLSDLMEIKCPFSIKKDMVYNQPALNKECVHDQKYDYLFINSYNTSVPFPDFEQECSDMIERLNASGKSFITTRKIDEYPCTLDYNLSVIEIARLAKNVKNIIGVNTGPLHLCMNKWVIPKLEQFITWCPTPENFNYGNKFFPVKSLSEVDKL
jgi:hypothetical protein|tara:strand:- start:56 stop:820 length:765 start_codon:yes stop_codon:yes gene_type:complete